MGLKLYRPYTPSRRNMSGYAFEDITKERPEKSLTQVLKKSAGRNNQGKVTSRHRGGGMRRMYRIIDFKRDKIGVAGKIAAIEYDPNRSARIALVYYTDGEKRYILCPNEVKIGDTIMAGETAEIKPGNSLPMRLIPSGTLIHNIELTRGKGAQLCRSAGVAAQLIGKEGDFALLRLPSGEMRRVRIECYATIGQVGNADHQNIKLGKAGRSRWLGIRPSVRGTAMTPRDHPHGGGSGRTPRGLPNPKTPWGKPALGLKTRKPKPSDKLIIKRRGA